MSSLKWNNTDGENDGMSISISSGPSVAPVVDQQFWHKRNYEFPYDTFPGIFSESSKNHFSTIVMSLFLIFFLKRTFAYILSFK